MKSSNYIIVVIILVALIIGLIIIGNIGIPPTTTPIDYNVPDSNIPDYNVPDYNFYTISGIKENNFSSGNFNTEGYVVKIYVCPPCPEGALCKTCMQPNIVVSENNVLLESYVLTEKEMIIFTGNLDINQFNLGSKYKFIVKITNENTTGEPINNIELIEYELIQ
ncbi:MAG: hypothetical protein WC462_02575 [archaeon]